MFDSYCLDSNGKRVYYVTQWDSNIELYSSKIFGYPDSTNLEVHIYNEKQEKSFVLDSVLVNGVSKFTIPNILLTEYFPIYIYFYLKSQSGNKSIKEIRLSVRKRKRPEGYVYTPTDVKTWNDKVDKSGWSGNKYLGTDSNGNVIEKNGGGDGGSDIFVVTFTKKSGSFGKFNADKKFSEIYSALQSNKMVIGRWVKDNDWTGGDKVNTYIVGDYGNQKIEFTCTNIQGEAGDYIKQNKLLIDVDDYVTQNESKISMENGLVLYASGAPDAELKTVVYHSGNKQTLEQGKIVSIVMQEANTSTAVRMKYQGRTYEFYANLYDRTIPEIARGVTLLCQVQEGAFVWLNRDREGAVLPPIGPDDNGKVLGVDGGKYALVTPAAGASEFASVPAYYVQEYDVDTSVVEEVK